MYLNHVNRMADFNIVFLCIAKINIFKYDIVPPIIEQFIFAPLLCR